MLYNSNQDFGSVKDVGNHIRDGNIGVVEGIKKGQLEVQLLLSGRRVPALLDQVIDSHEVEDNEVMEISDDEGDSGREVDGIGFDEEENEALVNDLQKHILHHGYKEKFDNHHIPPFPTSITGKHTHIDSTSNGLGIASSSSAELLHRFHCSSPGDIFSTNSNDTDGSKAATARAIATSMTMAASKGQSATSSASNSFFLSPAADENADDENTSNNGGLVANGSVENTLIPSVEAASNFAVSSYSMDVMSSSASNTKTVHCNLEASAWLRNIHEEIERQNYDHAEFLLRETLQEKKYCAAAWVELASIHKTRGYIRDMCLALKTVCYECPLHSDFQTSKDALEMYFFVSQLLSNAKGQTEHEDEEYQWLRVRALVRGLNVARDAGVRFHAIPKRERMKTIRFPPGTDELRGILSKNFFDLGLVLMDMDKRYFKLNRPNSCLEGSYTAMLLAVEADGGTNRQFVEGLNKCKDLLFDREKL